MSIEVIGAGFGRTGTLSLKYALEHLGYNKCYHMLEVRNHPDHTDLWRTAHLGQTVDWHALYEGYRATVDWPAAHYWRDLAAHFPDAKILLTYRDPDSWYASMEKTILTFLRDPTKTEGMAPRLRNEVFGGEVHDRNHVISVYNRHVAEVQSAFGPERRLLTYQLGSGWEPLCQFLGVDVPSAPYPSGNDSASYHAKDKELEKARKG